MKSAIIVTSVLMFISTQAFAYSPVGVYTSGESGTVHELTSSPSNQGSLQAGGTANAGTTSASSTSSTSSSSGTKSSTSSATTSTSTSSTKSSTSSASSNSSSSGVPDVYSSSNKTQNTSSSNSGSGSKSGNATAAPVTKCYIWVSQVCPAYRSLPVSTSFEDNYNGAATNSVVCLKRAKEYYDFCRNRNPGFVAYSAFALNGVTIIYAATAAGVNNAASPGSDGTQNYGVIALGLGK